MSEHYLIHRWRFVGSIVLPAPNPPGLFAASTQYYFARLNKPVMIVVNIRHSSRWLSAVTAMPMDK
jgi:hypothetical protein